MRPFHGVAGDTNVPTMHMSENLQYAETPKYKALYLPYAREDLGMTLILPHGDTTEGLDKDIASVYTKARSLLRYEDKVKVALPKCRLETEYSLASTFVELGAQLAFCGKADFSGITGGTFFIGDVLHKAFVEWDEEGTTAAAATAVVMKRGISPRAKEFIADRPFLFFINDVHGNIFFAGRVSNL